MLKIARALKDTEGRDAARAFEKDQKSSADQLADLLADFAVVIATAEGGAQAAGHGASGSRGSR
jgi:hypothetical protein